MALSSRGLDHARLLVGGELLVHGVPRAARHGRDASQGDGADHVVDAAAGRLGEPQREHQVGSTGDGHRRVRLDREDRRLHLLGHKSKVQGEGKATLAADLVHVVVVGDTQDVLPGRQCVAYRHLRVQCIIWRVEEVPLTEDHRLLAGLIFDYIHLSVRGEEVETSLDDDVRRHADRELRRGDEAVLDLPQEHSLLTVPEHLRRRTGGVQAIWQRIRRRLRVGEAAHHPRHVCHGVDF
mmetsp:Transcript_42356/g.121193  ORF Transcript_42356/g.121193 Transcript_42356/m.121193 type:complete len:238 (-) Transcript_42356:614-1327(-)